MNNKQYLNSDYIIYEDGRCYSNKSHKFLTPQMSAKYPTYNLTIDGIKKKVKVHRMVAEAFIPNPDNKDIVNHIDGDTHNFNVSNLEWATAQENSKHAIKSGLHINSSQIAITLKDNLIPDEEWRDIPDYPNYRISNYGRIVNITTKNLKRTPLDNNGYPHTSLWKNNRGKTFQIHRLEYRAFYPNDDLEGYVINHIDGDKTNNKLDNLEKVTYEENNKHAEYKIKTHACAKEVNQLDKNRNIIKTFPSIAIAEKETGTHCISRAIQKGYCANGYYWEFNN